MLGFVLREVVINGLTLELTLHGFLDVRRNALLAGTRANRFQGLGAQRKDGPSLGRMLDDVAVGKIQLPDFQRQWKWDDDRIRALLATVTLDYPLGVAMTRAQFHDGHQ